MKAAVLERRSNRLARAVQRLGIAAGDVVAIVCCDPVDREVAEAAVAKVGATAVVADCHATAEEFAELHSRLGVRAVLACGEGVELWRASRVGGLILGDGQGVPWWRLAELRESADPLTVGAA